MKYQYRAIDQANNHKDGIIEAPSEDIALVTLQNQGLTVTEIKELKAGFSFAMGGVSLADIAFVSRQLGVMIGARVSLVDSLRSIMRGAKNAALRDALFAIVNDITGGLVFSKALARHPKVFSEFYMEMVGTAEVTGTLSETLNYLADYYENQARLAGKFQAALVYPILVVAVAIVALVVVFGVVIPQIGGIFEQANIPIPFLTSVFLGISKAFLGFWWLLLGAAALGIYLAIEYLKTPEGKAMRDYAVLGIPVFGEIFKKLYTSRFVESFQTLVGGGISIDRALAIGASVVDNVWYARAIAAAAEDIKSGKKIHESLRRSGSDLFPELILQLIETGEATGELTGLLGRASKFYQEETNRDFNNLTEIIQSVLIIFLGGLLGLMEAAILIPIFSLTKNIGSL